MHAEEEFAEEIIKEPEAGSGGPDPAAAPLGMKWRRAYQWLAVGNAVWSSVYVFLLILLFAAAGLMRTLSTADTYAQTLLLAQSIQKLCLWVLLIAAGRAALSYALRPTLAKGTSTGYYLVFVQSGFAAASYLAEIVCLRKYMVNIILLSPYGRETVQSLNRGLTAFLVLLAALHGYLLLVNIGYFQKRRHLFAFPEEPAPLKNKYAQWSEFIMEHTTGKSTMITAHSGSDNTPPNSLESINKALSLGADAVEVDVRENWEGNLVLSHDPDPTMRYQNCLSLESAAGRLRGTGVRINLDLKETGLARRAIAVALECGLVATQLILTGEVLPSALEEEPEVAENADVYFNAENLLSPSFRLQTDPVLGVEELNAIASAFQAHSVKGVNINFRLLDENVIAFFEQHGIPLSVWTVNERDDLERFLSLGVANITTRQAALALSLRQ